jgi:hypothetical protein
MTIVWREGYGSVTIFKKCEFGTADSARNFYRKLAISADVFQSNEMETLDIHDIARFAGGSLRRVPAKNS